MYYKDFIKMALSQFVAEIYEYYFKNSARICQRFKSSIFI